MPWQPDYVTAGELAAYCHADESVDAADLALAVTGASRAVDRNTNRQFGLTAAAEVRQYTARWSKTRGAWLVPIDDLMLGPIVTLDLDGDGTYETTVDNAHLVKRPRNAAVKGRPWTELLVSPKAPKQPTGREGQVQVFVQFGWSAIPATVKLATRLQASRFFTRREAPFGVAGSPSEGSEMRLLAKVDPDVAVALDDFRRKAWVR